MASRALTNNRSLFFCSYDVEATPAGDKRRSRLFELLLDHGEHVQFSVFLCELTNAEVARLSTASREILNEVRDQLIILKVGPEGLDWARRLTCIGKPWTPIVRSSII